MDWQECNKKKFIKEVEIDKELIESLKNSSKNKFISASLLEMNEITNASIIILYYDSLRELLEALALIKGYKIYNHECFVYFLKEILKKDELAYDFDGIRKIRNSINYYGRKISLEETKIIISDIKKLIKEYKKLLVNQ